MPCVGWLGKFFGQVANFVWSAEQSECSCYLLMIVAESRQDCGRTEMGWVSSWSMQMIPPWKKKHRDLECWVVKSIAAQISIQVNDELQAGSEYTIWIHADLVH